MLKPLLEERNRWYRSWLSREKEEARSKFVSAQSTLRRVVKKVKNAWFQGKAMEVEQGKNSGKVAWHCIRNIQHGRRGLVPVKAAVV